MTLAGLVGTWAFNVAFIVDLGGTGHFEGWFANAASTSASIDLLTLRRRALASISSRA